MSARFDSWLSTEGPVALSIIEPLEPVSGEGSVIFPPTFAPPQDGDGEKSGYVIDENGTCLVDSLGSQANRLEPMFYKRTDLKQLVPQFTVKVGNRTVNLLDAGHRAADAVVRFSDKADILRNAFLDYQVRGDAQALAKIAPTSLVFGVWDSRDTGAKLPRLIESTIRAYGIERLTRSAQYFSVLEKEEVEEMGLDGLGQEALSKQGISNSPAGRTVGGVIAREGIQREALLNLIALRSLGTADEHATQKLRRYILGLALVAFCAPAELWLRQGCVLVGSQAKPATRQVIWRTGKRETFDLAEQEVLDFAKIAANEFGVLPSVEAVFDPRLVKKADEKKKGRIAAAKA